MAEKKQYKFIPALSAGALFSNIKGKRTFADGSRMDFWNFEDEFRYPYFLITAGHFYKKKNVAEDYNFFNEHPDNLIFGDSGGYQIAAGSIKWDLSIRNTIFNWLEENSTIAANLDIPTFSKEWNYDQCLAISKDNFNYFHENQSGRTKFLNVLQGYNASSYNNWYQEIKEFRNFHGWCVGNVKNSMTNLIDAFYVLLMNDEHKRSEYWHILGTSALDIVLALTHIQNALNEIGYPVQVFSDSSSPNSARFGYYYHDVDFQKLKWNALHIPYMRTDPEEFTPQIREIYESGLDSLPLVSEFDKKRYKHLITKDDLIEYNSNFAASLILRNTMFYVETFEKFQQFAELPEYHRKDIFNPDMAQIGTLINQMAESANDKEALRKVYMKSKGFMKKFTNKYSTKTNYIEHNFFE